MDTLPSKSNVDLPDLVDPFYVAGGIDETAVRRFW
jgi:hypothetical protein